MLTPASREHRLPSGHNAAHTHRTALLHVQGYEHPEAVAEIWLRCIVAGQYLSDRLLLDIQAVDYHMTFWQERLRSGNNTVFLAVARGPGKFVEACKAVVSRLRGNPPRMDLPPTHRIEQRVRPYPPTTADLM